MESAIKAPGIPATFEPVDWNPPGLPTDPDEIMACLVDPERRGELYPLYHQLRRVAPMYKNRPEIFHGALAITRFADADVLFRNARVVNDPQVVDEAFNNGDGSFTRVMRNVMIWQEPERAPARPQPPQGGVHARRPSPSGARSPSASPTSCATASKRRATPSSSRTTTTSSPST